MTAQLKSSPVTEGGIILTVLSGPESGVAYKLMGQSISLGRDAENDVVLQDVKASRRHAILDQRGGNYWIKDLGSQNGVIVNGNQVSESLLKPGDQVVIGATLMRFGAPQSLALVNSAPPVPSGPSPNAPAPSAQPLFAQPMGPPLSNRSSRSSKSGKRPDDGGFLPLVVVAVLIAGFVIFMQNPKAKKRIFNINDDAAVETELEDITSDNDKQQQEIARKGKDTQQYLEAQAFYLRGFREFREGNFGRAVQNFEAALALYPGHPLARRYLDRSMQKLDELVSQAIELGEKDFQQERYNSALNEYRTVLLLKNDPRDKMYQLALKRIEAINLIFLNNK